MGGHPMRLLSSPLFRGCSQLTSRQGAIKNPQQIHYVFSLGTSSCIKGVFSPYLMPWTVCLLSSLVFLTMVCGLPDSSVSRMERDEACCLWAPGPWLSWPLFESQVKIFIVTCNILCNGIQRCGLRTFHSYCWEYAERKNPPMRSEPSLDPHSSGTLILHFPASRMPSKCLLVMGYPA